MAPRRKALSFTLEVDERTAQMSDAALRCRSRGHKWEENAMTRRRYAELLAEGLWEDNLYCGNGCGATWVIIWKLRNGEIVTTKREYPRGGEYLMPKGNGRLARDSARVARVARQIPARV